MRQITSHHVCYRFSSQMVRELMMEGRSRSDAVRIISDSPFSGRGSSFWLHVARVSARRSVVPLSPDAGAEVAEIVVYSVTGKASLLYTELCGSIAVPISASDAKYSRTSSVGNIC